MGWQTLIPLIITQGLNVAQAIWQKWSTKQIPTQADWDQLLALAAQDAKARGAEALARAGIALDDPRATELMALIAKA